MPLSRQLVADVAAYADGWLAQRRATLGVPGVQAAVSYRGELVLETAHGLADVSTGASLTTGHLFRIASHSKTFTSTAVLQLAEQGRLRLDDPVADHVGFVATSPALAPLARLTLAELLAHGGGVTRDGVDGDYWQLEQPFPDAAGLEALLERGPAVFEANERFHYSNLGYSLLGLVIEQVAGTGYRDHVHRAVCAPLGLDDTDADLVAERLGDYTAGHTHANAGLERRPIDQVATGAMAPATGFTSTASDLCRYFTAHGDGDPRLLTDASKRRMRHVQWTPRPDDHYGLGLQVWHLGERTLVGHSGGWPGMLTKTWCDPVEGVVISVLTNAVDGPADEWCTGLWRLLDLVATPATVPVAHAEGVDLSRFAGRYVNLWGTRDIARLGDRLFRIAVAGNDPAAGAHELAVSGESEVTPVPGHNGYTSEGEAYRFDFAADGTVARLRGDSATSSWPEAEYERRFLAAARVRQHDGA